MTVVRQEGTQPVPRQRGGPLGWLRRRREERELAWFNTALSWEWEDTVEGADLVHRSMTAAGIPNTSIPRVIGVEDGPPLALVVRMLPGQVVDDFRAQAHRLAEGMCVPMVRVTNPDHGIIRVALLQRDPLTTPMPLPERTLGTSAVVPVLLGWPPSRSGSTSSRSPPGTRCSSSSSRSGWRCSGWPAETRSSGSGSPSPPAGWPPRVGRPACGWSCSRSGRRPTRSAAGCSGASSPTG